MTQVQQTPAQQAAPPPAPAVLEKNIAENVLARIKVFEETGTLNIPKNYSAPNALRAAWLILLETKDMSKRPVLEVCTKESVANALLRMIIQGLNPVKRQCSFIAYGTQLTMQREYQGTIALAKRDAGLVKVIGNAIFKDDVFKYSIDPATGIKTITEHTQTLESMEGEVKGAYAVKEYTDGSKIAEIMSISQIRAAWRQGPTKGESPAHKNFPDQMAVKSVINRALKIDINSSDDSELLDDGTPNGDDVKMANIKHRIGLNANKTELGITESPEGPASPAPEAPPVGEEKKEIGFTEPATDTNNPGY